VRSVRTLKNQLTLWFVVLAAIPLFVVGVLTIYYLSDTTEAEVLNRNNLLARSIAGEVERFLQEPLHALEEFGDNFLLNREFTEAWFVKYVSNFLGRHAYLQSVSVLNKKGIVHFVAPFNIDYVGIDMSTRDFFINARKTKKPYWSHVHQSLQFGVPSTSLAIPYDEFTVVGSLNLISLRDIIERADLSEHGYVAIADQLGNVIAHKEWMRVEQQAKLRAFDLVQDALARGETSLRFSVNDVKMLGSLARIPMTGWTVVVSQPVEEVFEQIEYIRNVVIVSMVVAILLAIFLSAVSLESILRPIRLLVRGTGKIAEGMYDMRELVELQGSYQEVEELSNSFEAMSEALENRERFIRESEQRYRNLFSSIRDVIIIADQDRTILDANQPALRELFGYEIDEVKGKNARIIYASDDAFLYTGKEVFERSERIDGKLLETEFRKKDGTIFKGEVYALKLIDTDGNITGNIGMVRDITEKLRLEEQLIHAQKMEAVGQLAGGVAHDFNNILTTIIGYASLLQMKMVSDDALKSHVESILSASDRAATLTRSLLAYSRKQIMQPRPVDINETLRKMEKFLMRIIGEDIRLKTDLLPQELMVNADQGQIEQVMMNLAANARDAMADGGTLQIRTEMVAIDREFIEKNGFGDIGYYALISMSDTGIGIDEDTVPKIFEPFFTTKEVGKGTGLGLAMVYGIIKQHNGFIDVRSRKGRGTTFYLYLPITEETIEPATVNATFEMERGTETILLAEDDSIVRELNREIVENAGYIVILASDGDQAVEQFMKCRDEIALLLLDVVMPGKNGKEVYDLIRKVKPDIKAVFVSGYNEELVQAKGVLAEGSRFIYKPIPPNVLLRTIREVLDLSGTGHH